MHTCTCSCIDIIHFNNNDDKRSSHRLSMRYISQGEHLMLLDLIRRWCRQYLHGTWTDCNGNTY